MKKLGKIILSILTVLNILFSTNCHAMLSKDISKKDIIVVKKINETKMVCASMDEIFYDKSEKKRDPKEERDWTEYLRKYVIEKIDIFKKLHSKKTIDEKDINDLNGVLYKKKKRNILDHCFVFQITLYNGYSFSIILGDETLHHIFYGNYGLEKMHAGKFYLKSHSGSHSEAGYFLSQMIIDSPYFETVESAKAKEHRIISSKIFNKKISSENDIINIINVVLNVLKNNKEFCNFVNEILDTKRKKGKDGDAREVHVHAKIHNIGFNAEDEKDKTDEAVLILKRFKYSAAPDGSIIDFFNKHNPAVIYHVATFYPSDGNMVIDINYKHFFINIQPNEMPIKLSSQ